MEVGRTEPLTVWGGGVGVQCSWGICFRVRLRTMETASLLSGAFFILFLVLRALGFCHVKKKMACPSSPGTEFSLRSSKAPLRACELTETQAAVLWKDPMVLGRTHFRKPGFVTTGKE